MTRNGAPRGPVGAPGGPPLRNTDNDIWAADLHLTPNGKFLYMTERTSSSLGTFSVDGASGKLIYLGSMPTEKLRWTPIVRQPEPRFKV
jgi:6-phosphogluconolactonase